MVSFCVEERERVVDASTKGRSRCAGVDSFPVVANSRFPVRLDATDMRLVESLLDDGRATNRVLASRIGLSESACHSRLKGLERAGIIVGYRAVVAFERLGQYHAWFDVTLTSDDAEKIAAFETLAVAEPQVIETYWMDGPCQFRLEVVTESFEASQIFSSRLLARSDLVRGVDRRSIYRAARARNKIE